MKGCVCQHPAWWHDDLSRSYPYRAGVKCRLCAQCGRLESEHSPYGHDFRRCECRKAS